MKLSILTVTTDRDKTYNNLLVKSIKETISLKEQDYEIIIHDNNHVNLPLSYAHAQGLTDAYPKTKGEVVLVLDSDTYFFKKDWDSELLSYFEKDKDVVFCSAIKCSDYQMPFFYRSHFLAIRDSFYRNLIVNQEGFFPESVDGRMVNDMSHKITKFCLDSDKKFVHYKNSCDDELDQFYRISGETVYNKSGSPFFHHVGRGSSKPERLLDWLDFWENHNNKE